MSEKKLKPTPVPWLASKKLGVPHDDDFCKLYPMLAAALWPVVHEGKLTRMAGWLALKLEGSNLLVKVVCPTEKLETTVAVSSLIKLYQEVESSITQQLCTWVPTWSESKKQRAALDKAVDAVIES
jgi:hypothetical protein